VISLFNKLLGIISGVAQSFDHGFIFFCIGSLYEEYPIATGPDIPFPGRSLLRIQEQVSSQ
jgi:hypothetical protein